MLLVGLWLGRARAAIVLPLTAVLFAGLHFSYSQSSFVALFAVVLAIALVLGGRKLRTTLAAGVAIAVVAAGTVTAASIADEGARTATSGRSRLVTVTLDAVQGAPARRGRDRRPASGERQESGTGTVKRNASHTTPLTVAAELGIVGLVVYGWLLVAGALALLRVTAARPRARPGALRRRAHAARALALLCGFLRGSAHVGRSRRQRREQLAPQTRRSDTADDQATLAGNTEAGRALSGPAACVSVSPSSPPSSCSCTQAPAPPSSSTMRDEPGGALDTELSGVSVSVAPELPVRPKPPPEPDRRQGSAGPSSEATRNAPSHAPTSSSGFPARKSLWARGMGAYMEYPPSYCDGTLYVSTFAGETFALDAETGQGEVEAARRRPHRVDAGHRR